MTGFPDHRGDGPEGFGPEGRLPGDPDEPLLRQPPGYLAPPPGEFGRLRRRAARRRRVRAAGGGLAAAGVLTGSLYLVGAWTPRDDDHAVRPPATDSLTSPTPHTVAPAPAPTTAPPTSRSGPHGSTPPTGSASPSSPTTGATPSRDAGTGGATQDGTTPMCTAGQLTAALGGEDAGAGSLFRYVVVTNHSSTTCHLTGYPGLSLLDADGKQIGAPAERQPLAYQPVVLKPGQSASDTLHTANRMGTCRPVSAKLRMYPPGSRESLEFPGEVTICDDLFTVTPLIAGRTGNPPA